MERTSDTRISPVDALWALYQGLSKRAKKTFNSRLFAEEKKRKDVEAMREYEKSLSEEEHATVCLMASTIKKGVDEVNQALSQNTHVGRSADDFLAELEQE